MGTNARNAVPIVYETQVLHLYFFTYVQPLDLEETTWLKGLACHLLPIGAQDLSHLTSLICPRFRSVKGSLHLTELPGNK